MSMQHHFILYDFFFLSKIFNRLACSIFIQEDLYAKICSLSYTGDVRMLFAEDRNKVNLHDRMW